MVEEMAESDGEEAGEDQLDVSVEEEEEEEELDDQEIEDLFNKNTASFRCLAQVLISRSSLLRHILYPFPPLEDPGIDEAFLYVEPEVSYDDIGCEKYKALCREFGNVPLGRVLRSLPGDLMDLKSYGLSMRETKAICSTMMLNAHVETLVFEENVMGTEACFWIGEMLRENNNLMVFNMKECRIGYEGMMNISEGLNANQSVVDLDLSFNDLGDNGVTELTKAIKNNRTLEKLNVSHNNLGDMAGKALGEFLANNYTITHLDLSWNDFFTIPALKLLCEGLMENSSVKYLNLAWNGIAGKAVGPINKYLKETVVLEHLDLNSNRLAGPYLAALKKALAQNLDLISINLSGNIITPPEASMLVQLFTKASKLQYLDLENVFVEKRFMPVYRRLTRQGKFIRIQGVINNYRIVGPNVKKVLFERCKFLAQKPKKKKQKRDFGIVLYGFPDTCIEKKDFVKLLKKNKVKLDKDIIATLQNTFATAGKVDLGLMKKTYMDLNPDFVPPPPPPKKGKKGKKKGKTKDATTETDVSVPVSPEQPEDAVASAATRSVTIFTEEERKSKRELMIEALKRASQASRIILEKSRSQVMSEQIG